MSSHPKDAIAIVGLGCRFPGGAHSPAAYLSFLEDCGDGVVKVPADRWSQDLHHDSDSKSAGRTNVGQGGFLQQDIFDFELTAAEMDTLAAI